MTYGSQQSFVLVGKQSSQDTGVTADKDIGIVRDFTPGLDKELKRIESVGAVDIQALETGNSTVRFGATIEFQHGRVLEMAFGTVGHAQTSSDWTHTFTLNQDNLSTWTMDGSYDSSTDTKFRAVGAMLESLEIGVELNGVLTAACTWKGISTASSATIGTRAIDTLVTFPHSLVTVSIDGSTAAEVQNFAITIQNTLQPVYGMGSNVAAGLNRTRVDFTFKGQLGFSAKTYLDLAQGGTSLVTGTPTATTVTLAASNGVSLGSGKRSFSLALASVQFDTFEKVASVGDLVFINVSGEGILSACTSVDDISSSNW